MNELIARHSLEQDALLEFVKTAAILDDLYHRIGELEETVEALDKNIEDADAKRYKDVTDLLCHTRNTINLQRLELQIQASKLEIKLAEFEKVRMLTK